MMKIINRYFREFPDLTFSIHAAGPKNLISLCFFFGLVCTPKKSPTHRQKGGGGWPLSWTFDSVSLQSGFWEQL